MFSFDNKELKQAAKPLITPKQLNSSLPLSQEIRAWVIQQRAEAIRIMQGHDKRLLVIVGPCSIHDVKAALEYARLLQQAQHEFKDTLFIVMRVYFEKPRTRLGWRGLIIDPHLDESADINTGLTYARKLLLDLAHLKIPAATEFLDTLSHNI